MNTPILRPKAFPCVIQLDTRKDYKEYFKLAIK